MKNCTVCKTTKPLTDFHKRKTARDKHTSYCKSCKNNYDKIYVVLNKDKSKIQDKLYKEKNKKQIQAYVKKYYLANKKKINKKNHKNFYMYKYGITLEDKLEMIARQENRCAICYVNLLGTKDAYVDHNHSTKKVRAILCQYCNMGLGSFKDNGELLMRAIDYLKKYDN